MGRKTGRRSLFGRVAAFFFTVPRTGGHAVASVCAAVGLLACIVLAAFLCLVLFSRTFPALGILLSTAAGCLLTVPLTLVLTPLLRSLIRRTDDGRDRRIAAQDERIAALERRNEALAQEGRSYEQKIRLLENLTFNMSTYSDVLKVCFRDHSRASTIKMREQYNQSGAPGMLRRLMGSHAESYDEVLSIMDCVVTYQSGVDLSKIRVAKVNDDTVVISGIRPEHTARPRFDYKDFFSEIRHVRADKDGRAKHISVAGDPASEKLLATRQAEYKAQYEDAVLSGQEQVHDAAEIVRRAQDFIKIILQPVYRHVQFSEDALAQDSVPLLDYLRTETSRYQELLRKAPGASPEAIPAPPGPA